MTVCLDVEGADGAKPDLAAVDEVTHIAVVDQTHAIDRHLGIVNVPMAVWIDEDLNVVRPAEFAWPGEVEGAGQAQLPDEIPERMMNMAATAGRISVDRTYWLDALRDWAASGAESSFVLAPDVVIGGSVDRNTDHSAAAAHFELAQRYYDTGRFAESAAAAMSQDSGSKRSGGTVMLQFKDRNGRASKASREPAIR